MGGILCTMNFDAIAFCLLCSDVYQGENADAYHLPMFMLCCTTQQIRCENSFSLVQSHYYTDTISNEYVILLNTILLQYQSKSAQVMSMFNDHSAEYRSASYHPSVIIFSIHETLNVSDFLLVSHLKELEILSTFSYIIVLYSQ